ncbi:MAG: hypothetical protein ACRDSZ_06140 [Pseudonocardiaceae bacterium]
MGPARWFVVCHNPEQPGRDAAVRANLFAHLQQLIDGSDDWTPRRRDELVGSPPPSPACAAPAADCYASTTPPSAGRRTGTASGCCAPPMSP